MTSKLKASGPGAGPSRGVDGVGRICSDFGLVRVRDWSSLVVVVVEMVRGRWTWGGDVAPITIGTLFIAVDDAGVAAAPGGRGVEELEIVLKAVMVDEAWVKDWSKRWLGSTRQRWQPLGEHTTWSYSRNFHHWRESWARSRRNLSRESDFIVNSPAGVVIAVVVPGVCFAVTAVLPVDAEGPNPFPTPIDPVELILLVDKPPGVAAEWGTYGWSSVPGLNTAGSSGSSIIKIGMSGC